MKLFPSHYEWDMWIWEMEQNAIHQSRMWAELKRPELSALWLNEANRLRLIRWPKDRQFQPLIG